MNGGCTTLIPPPKTHQEVPDFSGRRTELTALGDKVGLDLEKVQVKKRASEWISRSSESIKKQLWRPRKRHRQAACSWLRHVDCMLQRTTGAGIKAFQQPVALADRDPDATTWPSSSCAPDMESAGHSGALAAQRFFNLNMDYTPDTSHGGHRCLLDALKKSGLFPYVATMMVVRAVPHGPWGEDQRFRQAQASLADHLENTDPSQCLLFQMLAVAMLRDKGWEDMAGSDDVEEILWDLLREASPFTKKGCKGNLNRFMSVVRELRALDKDWHTTQYGWVLCSLELDFFKGTKFLELLSKLNLGELLEQQVDDECPGLRAPSAAEKAIGWQAAMPLSVGWSS